MTTTVPPISSTSGDCALTFPTANAALRILADAQFRGAKAIHVSRFKKALVDHLQDVEKERLELIKPHAEHDGDQIRTNSAGAVVFISDADRIACEQEIMSLLDESTLHLDAKAPAMKIILNHVYGILTGDDCPVIPKGEDWWHVRLVDELSAALDKKD